MFSSIFDTQQRNRRITLRLGTTACAVCLLLTWQNPAHAQISAPTPATAPAPNAAPVTAAATPDAAATPASPSPGQPGFADSLFAPSRSNLLGSLWDVRPLLDANGISLGITDIAEVFGNATGGMHRGAAFDGATQLSLGIDTAKLFGWDGGTANISAYQIHGRNLSADNLRNLQSATGIEAQRATRLWEMWFQQSILGGKLSMKIGQQSLDQEFIVSAGSALFVNTAMGWPLLPSLDLFAGGPAYPLASLGVRLQAQPTGALTLLAGVFDDNPAGGALNNDTQTRGATQSGTEFNLRTGALAIAEIQYAADPLPATGGNAANAATGHPGVYKLGAWLDTGTFADQRTATNGLSLADPRSSGTPFPRTGNWSVYGVMDQNLWQQSATSARAIAVFARIMAAPDNRNLASFSLNAGLTLKMPFPGRDHDTLGLGYGLAKISRRAAELDQDQSVFSHGSYPVRSSESFIELTYQAQMAPWLSLQPDIQYIFTPAGGVALDGVSSNRIKNEVVFGIRATTIF